MANKVELAGAAGADNSSSAPIFVSNALFGSSASFTPAAAAYTAGDVFDVAQETLVMAFELFDAELARSPVRLVAVL
jgi:hypothetical protein